jgi:hypothetical protein
MRCPLATSSINGYHAKAIFRSGSLDITHTYCATADKSALPHSSRRRKIAGMDERMPSKSAASPSGQGTWHAAEMVSRDRRLRCGRFCDLSNGYLPIRCRRWHSRSWDTLRISSDNAPRSDCRHCNTGHRGRQHSRGMAVVRTMPDGRAQGPRHCTPAERKRCQLSRAEFRRHAGVKMSRRCVSGCLAFTLPSARGRLRAWPTMMLLRCRPRPDACRPGCRDSGTSFR